jgi:hypothetical protein
MLYGENNAGHINNIPPDDANVYPLKGHPLSGLYVVKGPLSNGWDIICAIKPSAINNELKPFMPKAVFIAQNRNTKVK